MQKEEKKQFVEEFKEEVGKAESVVLTNYQGLDVNSITELRWKLKESGCVMKVVKNRLARRAFQDIDEYKDMAKYLSGPTAVLFGTKDPSESIKIYKNFIDEDNEMGFKSAVINDNLLDAESLKKLADLPSRKVLLGQVVRVTNAPVQNLYSGLKNIIQKFLYALNDYKDNLEEEGGTEEKGTEESTEDINDKAEENIKEQEEENGGEEKE
ncbi:MAG: 50S ribosomal protein L10 [Elusimicrobiota bacterium]